ncbi:MAG: lipoprotein [Pseudomonadota bacterium]
MTRPNPSSIAVHTVCPGAVLLAALMLAGCGQTGALYLPTDAPATAVEEDAPEDAASAPDKDPAGSDDTP